MKILFITATRLGDAVLSTGALDYLIKHHPGADITVACGQLVAGLFAPAPGVSKVIVLKKGPFAAHWVKLARETLNQKWDVVVDLRNSLLSRLLRGNKKYIWGHMSAVVAAQHKVEQIANVMEADPPPAPRLWFDAAADAWAESRIPHKPVLAIGPTANWPGKEWPKEYFIELIEKLTAADGILPGAPVAVFAAPGEEKRALPVLESVPESRRIDMIAKGTPLQAGAALTRSALYIGNDSGLTHTAAAAGAPTLGLFGYGWPARYRPWGPRAAFVSTPETPEQLLKPFGTTDKVKTSLMTSLTVTAALEAAVRLWLKTR